MLAVLTRPAILFALFVNLAFAFPCAGAALPGFADAIERASPSIVSVATVKAKTRRSTDPGLDQLFEAARRQQRAAGDERAIGGAGVILSADGYILTANSIVTDVAEVLVILADEREFSARIVGTDAESDIALLKIDAAGLPPFSPADPATLRLGDWVLSVGSPYGMARSISAGIVSFKAREMEGLYDLIQSDATINPGNAGGPLLNLHGQVVGVASIMYSPTGTNSGLGFYVPIEVALQVAERLRVDGRVVRGFIGVSVAPLSRAEALAAGLSQGKGVRIDTVKPGTPAAAAGLLVGDVVLAIDAKPVPGGRALRQRVAAAKVGGALRIAVRRAGAERLLQVIVGADDKELR